MLSTVLGVEGIKMSKRYSPCSQRVYKSLVDETGTGSNHAQASLISTVVEV